MKKNNWKRIISIVCTVCLLAGLFAGDVYTVKAGTRILTLSQAKKLAYLSSVDYKKIKSKINLQKIKYTEAVKSIALKQKNMLSFRWSPLLSFKFPEQPDMAKSYEWIYKPMQIQIELSSLKHELNDVKYKVDERVSNLYVTAYCTQEKISFTEERLNSLTETLKRNKWKVKSGTAKQADVDKIQSQVKKLTADLSLLMRQLETAKRKLGEAAGMDVTWAYRFENPYVKGTLDRSVLKALTEYTLSCDQGYYKAKLDARAGLISMELSEKLLKRRYKKYFHYIQPYINQARQGKKIDTDAFKESYDQFLYALDSRWMGNYRILFIKIPKEWLKGALDGVRYIEEDPYAMYTNILEYESLRLEEESVKKEVETAVYDSFEALITAGNALNALRETVADMELELKKSQVLNREGKLELEELLTQQEEYEEYQNEMLDSLASYSSALYSFDRLSCGGITKYLKEGSLSLSAGAGGESYLTEGESESAYYTLESRMEDNLFVLTVRMPEESKVKVTDFELWVDGTQIGDRTAIDEPIRHLALTMDDVEKAVLRFYNKDKFVDECEIDPMVTRGDLEIKGAYKAASKETKKKVADYSYTDNSVTGMTEIKIEPVTGEGIVYYQITDIEGNPLYEKKAVSVTESFRYLQVAAMDQKNLRVIFYDVNKKELYTGKFDQNTLEIIVEESSD